MSYRFLAFKHILIKKRVFFPVASYDNYFNFITNDN